MKPKLTASLIAALALAAGAGCGGDGGGTTDDPLDPDAMETPPDGPPGDPTFTDYVIDMIEHRTADDTDPAPFAEFSELEDVDLDDPTAYDALF